MTEVVSFSCQNFNSTEVFLVLTKYATMSCVGFDILGNSGKKMDVSFRNTFALSVFTCNNMFRLEANGKMRAYSLRLVKLGFMVRVSIRDGVGVRVSALLA